MCADISGGRNEIKIKKKSNNIIKTEKWYQSDLNAGVSLFLFSFYFCFLITFLPFLFFRERSMYGPGSSKKMEFVGFVGLKSKLPFPKRAHTTEKKGVVSSPTLCH